MFVINKKFWQRVSEFNILGNVINMISFQDTPIRCKNIT